MWRLASHAPSDRGLARGSAWQRTTTPYNNKETVSVNMTWGLSGHNYGVQLVLKRKEITEDLAVDAPRHARAFETRLTWCASSHATASCRARKCEIAPRGCAYRISPLAFPPVLPCMRLPRRANRPEPPPRAAGCLRSLGVR